MKELFIGEEINNSAPLSRGIKRQMSDMEIDKKYIDGDIRIVTEQGRFQLASILSLISSPDYILNPEFQRRLRWGREKQSKLIESFIMNVPVPPIFLYEIKFATYEVMDGLQRLTALSEFYQDKYELIGLVEWPELNGKKYSDLPEQVRRGIDRRYLSSVILLNETAGGDTGEGQRLKELVFERINSGGEKLEPQESRNALYNGKLNQLCIDLARNEYFCQLFNLPLDSQIENGGELDVRYKKMEDVELVLRFFAFRQLGLWEGTLENYLTFFLKQGNKFSKDVLDNYKKLFEETISLVFGIYGEQAFNLYRERGGEFKLYNRPTKVLYDPMMSVLSEFIADKNTLLDNKEQIIQDTAEFHEKNYDYFGGRNTGKKDVEIRINLYREFLSRYV